MLCTVSVYVAMDVIRLGKAHRCAFPAHSIQLTPPCSKSKSSKAFLITKWSRVILVPIPTEFVTYCGRPRRGLEMITPTGENVLSVVTVSIRLLFEAKSRFASDVHHITARRAKFPSIRSALTIGMKKKLRISCLVKDILYS